MSMSPEQQQIALCEWMGWTEIENHLEFGLVGFSASKHFKYRLPNTNSLDVLHEMESKLTKEQWITYIRNLCFNWEYWVKEGGYHAYKTITHAPASQRREALLKTLGLWKDS